LIAEDRAKKDDLAALLFELANDDRLALLYRIAAKKQRMSTLSNSLNLSTPECARHLSRLSDAGLVRKDSSGLYEASPMGRTVLKVLPGLETIVRNKEFFLAHDLSMLPEEFVERIGALAQAELVTSFGEVLDRVKRTIDGAEIRSFLMVDKPLFLGKEGDLYSAVRDFPARFIFHESVSQKVMASVKAHFPRSAVAVAKEILVATGVTEKYAGVVFQSDGKLDFGNGFFGDSPQFRTWCGDLFEFCWSRSRKVYSSSPFSD
jgi:predicted transcriptional regulator